MSSKIINMADHGKDALDERLEQLFAADAIADDGFSIRVTSRLKRRAWLRRLILGGAAALGAAIAFRPTVELVSLVSKLLPGPVSSMLDIPTHWATSPQVLVGGVLLFGLLMFGLGLLED